MSRLLVLLVVAAGLGLTVARADSVGTNANAVPTAAAILARLQTQRAPQDFSLQARLFVTREQVVPLEILIDNRPDGTRALYRGADLELLVIQPDDGRSRFYVRGRGELTGDQRLEPVLGSQFSYYDLGLEYLHWPAYRVVGTDRHRGQDCWVLEARAEGEPFSRARLWVQRDAGALLRTELYDRDDRLRRRFAVTSIRRVGEVWVPRGMVLGVRPPGQAMPSEETSRLLIYDGRYDVDLPADLFDPGRFIPAAGN